MADGVRARAPHSCVVTIPNGSDFALFDKASEDRDEFRKSTATSEQRMLVYAGSLGATYDVGWLVDLAAELQASDTIIVIIGEGAMSPRLRQRIDELRLDNIVLTGAIPKSDVADYVASADAVFSTLQDHPALLGNSLNKVFDAMAARRPILFNHEGWLAELASERGAGWILNRDVRVAGRQIVDILNDGEALARAGDASGTTGQEFFDRDTLYEHFHATLTAAVGG
nr:glycosyltransferase [Georgenia subflava]